MGEKNDRIKELEKQLEDLKRRWPAYSVKPVMVQRLFEPNFAQDGGVMPARSGSRFCRVARDQDTFVS